MHWWKLWFLQQELGVLYSKAVTENRGQLPKVICSTVCWGGQWGGRGSVLQRSQKFHQQPASTWAFLKQCFWIWTFNSSSPHNVLTHLNTCGFCSLFLLFITGGVITFFWKLLYSICTPLSWLSTLWRKCTASAYHRALPALFVKYLRRDALKKCGGREGVHKSLWCQLLFLPKASLYLSPLPSKPATFIY